MSDQGFDAEGKYSYSFFNFGFIDELKNALDEIKRNEKD